MLVPKFLLEVVEGFCETAMIPQIGQINHFVNFIKGHRLQNSWT